VFEILNKRLDAVKTQIVGRGLMEKNVTPAKGPWGNECFFTRVPRTGHPKEKKRALLTQPIAPEEVGESEDRTTKRRQNREASKAD